MSALRSVSALSAVIVVVFFCVGCSSQPVAGVVKRQPALSKGSFVPDIPFTTADGKQTTLFAVRQSITIVGFVKVSAEGCCQVDSELARLSAEFRRLPVTIVQVVMPQDADRPDPSHREMPDLKRADPVLLYDQDRVAWNGYGKPKPGTLVLINKYGTIIEVSDIQNRRTLTQKATILAMDEMDDHMD